MTDDLKPLNQRVKEKVQRELNKSRDGELSEFPMDIGFPNKDEITISLVKGHRYGTVERLTIGYRTYQASRSGGFSVKEDLDWTIRTLLSDVGL